MLRIAIIGCGKIADSHAAQIQRIPNCEIVGVCDREPLMAQQLTERFRVRRAYHDLEHLFDDARPDVLHITTPPDSHFRLARLALERGCHVYVEKPFTLDADEAAELIRLAQDRGCKLAAGHDDQFRPAARRMRRMIAKGYLGGPPVHMESYYCYEFDAGSPYARALLADRNHWIRQLPGQLLHNIISHGIARIAEFMTSDCPEVLVLGFVGPKLRRLGEFELIDELRVVLSDHAKTTAYFTFSSGMRPSLHQFRIFGPRNGLQLDQDNETLIRLRGSHYTSFVEQFVPPLSFALQYAGCFAGNFRQFLQRDFHPKGGMKHLIEAFYHSIVQNTPPPIPYSEILRVAHIMDAIFLQLRMGRQERVDTTLAAQAT